MIRLITAATAEVDDMDDALADILGQIDLNALDAHSVGILSCYYEFIESGVVKALSEKLPFDIIGLTTMAGSVNKSRGMYQLSLAVLTSDDVSFRAGMSEPLAGTDNGRLAAAAYEGIKKTADGDTSFVIAFFPVGIDIHSGQLLKALDTAASGAPIWGSGVSDITMDFEHAAVIYNDRVDRQGLAMILASSKSGYCPEFFVTAIPDRNISKRHAIITESEGNIIKKVNNIPIKDYFESLGLLLRGGINAASVPMMLNYGDGSEPTALTIIIDDDGFAHCAGDAPVGASFSIGEIDREGILETAIATVERALKAGQHSGLLMFPCVSRYMMLSPASVDEMERVRSLIGALPHWLAYSGGEFCPVRGSGGRWYNRFHHYTFTICAL